MKEVFMIITSTNGGGGYERIESIKLYKSIDLAMYIYKELKSSNKYDLVKFQRMVVK